MRLATLTRADAIRREQTLSRSAVGVADRMHETRKEDTCPFKTHVLREGADGEMRFNNQRL